MLDGEPSSARGTLVDAPRRADHPGKDLIRLAAQWAKAESKIGGYTVLPQKL